VGLFFKYVTKNIVNAGMQRNKHTRKGGREGMRCESSVAFLSFTNNNSVKDIGDMYIELLNLMLQEKNSSREAVKRVEILLTQDGAAATLLAIFYTGEESLVCN